MPIVCSEFTPVEPDWKAVIAEMRNALAPDPTRNPPNMDRWDPVILTGHPEPVAFKFMTTKSSEMQEVLRRVVAANKEAGTPKEKTTSVESSTVTLNKIAHVQTAIESYAVPGVFVIWNVYRADHARKTEFRVAVWVVPLTNDADLPYLVGDRATGVPAMFFRRQHVVRVVHASGPVYYDKVTHLKQTFVSQENDGVVPHWIEPKDSMIYQAVDYATAERLASGDIEVWNAAAVDSRLSNAVQHAAGEAVERYAKEHLQKLDKL